MKKFLFLFLFLIIYLSSVSAVPQLPMIINGDVTINEKPAKTGTIITAKVDNKEISRTEVTKEGYYVLLIQKPVEGNIKLFVDNIDTEEILSWKQGDYKDINLNVKKSYLIYYITGILIVLIIITWFLKKRRKR